MVASFMFICYEAKNIHKAEDLVWSNFPAETSTRCFPTKITLLNDFQPTITSKLRYRLKTQTWLVRT